MFQYKDLKMLFTGDIEEIAEKELLKQYLKQLQADIIKIAHHGSKSSTSQQFLKEVSPRIALIGVGESNKFGHPNDEVIKRLQKLKVDMYRTDESGEINIVIDGNGGVKIKKFIDK